MIDIEHENKTMFSIYISPSYKSKDILSQLFHVLQYDILFYKINKILTYLNYRFSI